MLDENRYSQALGPKFQALKPATYIRGPAGARCTLPSFHNKNFLVGFFGVNSLFSVPFMPQHNV